MSYKRIYDHCQNLTPKVSRNQITPEVLKITGAGSIRVAYTDKIDPRICRGFFIDGNSHRYGAGKFIVIHRDLNYCWKRMVFVKELMHLFDKDEEKTASDESFENLLNDLALPEIEEMSPQIESESNAIWMALGLLCPEKYRKQYKKEKDSGIISNYEIAVRLRIPEFYVPLIFHPVYEPKISELLK